MDLVSMVELNTPGLLFSDKEFSRLMSILMDELKNSSRINRIEFTRDCKSKILLEFNYDRNKRISSSKWKSIREYSELNLRSLTDSGLLRDKKYKACIIDKNKVSFIRTIFTNTKKELAFLHTLDSKYSHSITAKLDNKDNYY